MKRISVLFGIFVLLVMGYVGLRAFRAPADFEAPQAIRFDDVDFASVDAMTMVFAQDQQMEFQLTDGVWFVGNVPADSAKIQSILDAAKTAMVESRVSSNSQYHERFEVGDKGVRLTLLSQGSVKKELVFGKAAGGDAVYVRVPEQQDVYVMNGFPRYALTQDLDSWRDRALARFGSDRVRAVSYVENQIQWDLRRVVDGWTAGTNRIAAMPVDTAKTESYVKSVAGLRAVAFPTTEEIESAKTKQATFSTVTVEVGTPEAFERKEVWSVYTTKANDRLLVIRDVDQVGMFVDPTAFDEIFGDFAQLKVAVTASATPEEAVK